MSDTPSPRQPEPPRPATLQGLSNRLRIKTPMVRKIAMLDMIKRQDEFGKDAVAAALLKHLPNETNPPLILRIIGYLGESKYAPAREPLEKLAKGDPNQVGDVVIQSAKDALKNMG